MGRRISFTGLPAIEREDGEASLELELLTQYENDVGVYATIGSWDDSTKHKVLAPFVGQQLRVRVEVTPRPMDQTIFEEDSDADLERARKEATEAIGRHTAQLHAAEDPLQFDKAAANVAHDTILSLQIKVEAIDRVRAARKKSLEMEE